MNNTSFSVLMSLYHKERPEFLRQSLDSVFNQTLPADEVILVEDGPLTDELYKVLDEYADRFPQLKRIPLPNNVGLGKALNVGLKYCSYDLVARMDTDDICFQDRFERQIIYMEAHPEIDIISGWLEEFEESPDRPKSIKKVPHTHAEIGEYMKTRNPLNHPAVMFRKKAVEAVDGYKHFPLFEDYYLWVRMFKNGAKFANIQEPLLHFRTSPEMFRRRGGLKYACDCIKFQKELYRLGIINRVSAIKASILRGGVYVMPNSVRKLIYAKLLRN